MENIYFSESWVIHELNGITTQRLRFSGTAKYISDGIIFANS
jgi:hypothetical protein